jgi:hypothetical protein
MMSGVSEAVAIVFYDFSSCNDSMCDWNDSLCLVNATVKKFIDRHNRNIKNQSYLEFGLTRTGCIGFTYHF